MFELTFASKPVYCARQAAAEVAELGKPVPPDFHKANSFLNPLGESPARGWLLMKRSDLTSINLNALHDLIIKEVDGENQPRKATVDQLVKYLVVAKEPLNLFPSNTANDPDALYLVEVADARWRVHNPHFSVAANKQYNVRAPSHGADSGVGIYYADSLNSGSAWTWTTMVQNLWGLMTAQLGGAPSLPITPDGTPEGFVFIGVPAWLALCQVLRRIGCAVKWTPSLGAGYSIVQVGAADTAQDALITQAENQARKIHDAEPLAISRGKLPIGCRVFFHRNEQHYGTEQTTPRTSSQWQSNAAYTVDVAGPDTSGEAGVYHPIWDDLPAIYDIDGAMTNSSALTTRATERTNDYFRARRTTGGELLWKIYSGIVKLTPGSTIKGVGWRQTEAFDDTASFVTQIVRNPGHDLRVSDKGEFEQIPQAVSRLKTPDFGPTHPNYPRTQQSVELVSSTPSGGYYDAAVQKTNPVTRVSTAKESVWIFDINDTSLSDLPVGTKWSSAKLNGFANGRPVYLVDIAAAGESSETTYIDYHFSFSWQYADLDLSLFEAGIVIIPKEPKVRIVGGSSINAIRNPLLPARPICVRLAGVQAGRLFWDATTALFFGLGNIPRGTSWVGRVHDELIRFQDPDTAVVDPATGYMRLDIIDRGVSGTTPVEHAPGSQVCLVSPAYDDRDPRPAQMLVLWNVTGTPILIQDFRSAAVQTLIQNGQMRGQWGILLPNFHLTAHNFPYLLHPNHALILEFDAVIGCWRFDTPPLFRGCSLTDATPMRPGMVPVDDDDPLTCEIGCKKKYLDKHGKWSSPLDNQVVKKVTVVTDVTFNSATCSLVVTKTTICFVEPCLSEACN